MRSTISKKLTRAGVVVGIAIMAGSVVATLPVLIVFLIFQRHFVRGIAMSGLK